MTTRESTTVRTHIDDLPQARDLTWDQLAAETGIGKPTLHKLAHGKSKSIRLEHLDALCTYFRVPIGDLLIADIVAVPLQPDPALQARARKAAAGRGSDDEDE